MVLQYRISFIFPGFRITLPAQHFDEIKDEKVEYKTMPTSISPSN